MGKTTVRRVYILYFRRVCVRPKRRQVGALQGAISFGGGSHCLTFLSLLLISCLCAVAQTPGPTPLASILGRVTIGGKGAAGITIAATSSNSLFDRRTVAKTTTDSEGNYELTGLAAGRFTILPLAKAYLIATSGTYKQPGQEMNVAAGESITKIDFALVRGGVITGRITDADGLPIIGELVNVALKDNARSENFNISDIRNQTDDRGVYRIYGLGPGSYKVSVGHASGTGSMGMRVSKHQKTFYPGVPEESKATVIEISEGTEISRIDITPGKSTPGFSVSGRVVDAKSGQPVPDVYVACSLVENEKLKMDSMDRYNRADAKGNFRLEDLQPGHYAAFSNGTGPDNSSYSELAQFEIADGDLTGVEVKTHNGATISGMAVIENNFDPAVAALLQTVVLNASVAPKGLAAPSFSSRKINPDGTFSLSGLGPGKVHIGPQFFPLMPKGLTLARIEFEGSVQDDGIEVTAGAQVTGLRLVFAYGTGTIRGEVKIEGGELPAGTRLQLSLRSGARDTGQFSPYIGIDGRGRFVAENISPGVHELYLKAVSTESKLNPLPIGPVTQSVTVQNDTEVKVTLVLDLGKKAEPE